MGQAFRRAAGKVEKSGLESSTKLKNTVDRPRVPTPAITVENIDVSKAADDTGIGSEDAPRINTENVLEERDLQYDSMLNQMVGRIKTKPGGKLEMGEASVVERYNRPMPKLRNTKPDSGMNGERAVAPGTLKVAQIRQIMLLHQGKADDHNGPMDIQQIAEKFRIDSVQVEKILQFISLPPENNSKQKNKQ